MLVMLLGLEAPEQSRVDITYPKATDYIVGDTTVELSVSPGSDRITAITVSVDGNLACRLTAAPYRCRTDVGLELKARAIRVVATLASGEHIVKMLLTANVPVVERADVSSVLVSVSVRDSDGQSVAGLKPERFTLFEDDRVQDVKYFAAAGAPRDLLIAVDVSGSMTRHVGAIRQGVKTMLRAVRAEDTVTVAAFNSTFSIIADPNTPTDVKIQAVDRLETFGGTALYDAMFSALDVLSARKGRHALVLFTDGEDGSSQGSADGIERRLLSEDVVLYVVAHGSAADSPPIRDHLRKMAEASGGRAIFLTTLSKAEKAFREVLDDLSELYTLGFSPSEAGPDRGLRRLRVEVSPGKYQVHSRQAYVPKSSPK
jgi:Ca-activated chloride channel family protein